MIHFPKTQTRDMTSVIDIIGIQTLYHSAFNHSLSAEQSYNY